MHHIKHVPFWSCALLIVNPFKTHQFQECKQLPKNKTEMSATTFPIHRQLYSNYFTKRTAWLIKVSVQFSVMRTQGTKVILILITSIHDHSSDLLTIINTIQIRNHQNIIKCVHFSPLAQRLQSKFSSSSVAVLYVNYVGTRLQAWIRHPSKWILVKFQWKTRR